MKKLKKFFLVAVLFFYPNFLHAAFEYKEISAKSTSLAGIKTVSSGEALAVFYNPAGIETKKNYEINTFYTKFYEIDELGLSAIAFVLPFYIGKIGFGYNSFGETNFYKEETYALAYNVELYKNVFLALAYKNLVLDLGAMGFTTRLDALDFGARFVCDEKSELGFSYSNFNSPKIGKFVKEPIAREINVGYSYLITKSVKFMFECSKQEGYEVAYKTGVEATYLERLSMRCGYRTDSEILAVGFGINNFLEYAYNYHFDLGNQHFFCVKFGF